VTVGFHAPLPPVRSGVAGYADRLLKELRKRGRVELAPSSADAYLYHLGNNQLHRGIYQRALKNPGIVVLHDAVLQHFYLGALNQSQYVEEYVYNYGEWERSVAADLYASRAGSGMDLRFYQRPMVKRVAERSLAVIVHNPAAAAMVREHRGDARVIEIPHFFDSPNSSLRSMRPDWHMEETNFVFGVFGFLRESKRVLAVLNAFFALHQDRPHTRLLLAGDFASSDLERAVRPYLAHPGVVRMGHLEEREFWGAASSVDCCVNLRAPSAGETSGIGIRLMGLGKPVFFTDGREIEELPSDACVRISSGLSEDGELFEYMKIVVDLPQYARAIGSRGAAYIRRVHSLDRIADLYWEALCEVCTVSSSSLPS
jgi:glycosyltransferase involved in cell wall biosynthesis